MLKSQLKSAEQRIEREREEQRSLAEEIATASQPQRYIVRACRSVC